MPDQTDKSTRKERARKATETANKMSNAFKQAQIGKTVEVLFEQKKHGCWTGHSGNYLEISVKENVDKNSIHKVRIIGIKNGQLQGEIV